ncbi:MAG: GGDEF domain-containing protein [Erysipelotrichaceae bacterium]|nr:GGDEF domain-containing protein [Erysipelotrichaceae bacterium]
MENRHLTQQLAKKQYHDQAILVYMGTIIISSFLAIMLHFLVGNVYITTLNISAIFIAMLAIWLTKRQHYSLASVVYISFIVFSSSIQLIVFGILAGYQYFFFNLAALVVFTSWQKRFKLMALLLISLVFIALFFWFYNNEPLIALSDSNLILLHTINAVLNIAGVSNSAIFYVDIATKANMRLSQLAMRDYLTNVMNRTSFDSFITEKLTEQKNKTTALVVMFLDIDHFKDINDNYGHLCGDELLKQFAHLIMSSIDKNASVARYGGEEFVIVAEVLDYTQMVEIAEQLRRKVEANIFGKDEKERRITVSIGSVFIPSFANVDVSDVLDQTDKLLYQAKAAGRNSVIAAEIK